ncbi:MAG: hypothetical protein O3A46_16315, partial [Candidatus Poribacteria bacterium]|nr:hypothetical protein [Candidatus Poribacteria bacterium]
DDGTIYRVESTGGATYSRPWLVKSEDGGATWVRVWRTPSYSDPNFIILVDQNLIYVAGSGGVSYSWDGGERWREVDPDTSPWRTSDLLADDEYLYAASADGVFRARLGEGGWTVCNDGISGQLSMYVAASSNGTVLAHVHNDGHYRSVNDGASWEPLEIRGVDRHDVKSIFEYDGKMYATISRLYYEGTWERYDRSTLESDDSGETWHTFHPDFGLRDVVSHQGDLFGASSEGVIRRTNGVWQSAGLDGDSIRSLTSDGESLYATIGAIPFRSSDGGASWERVGFGPLSSGAVHDLVWADGALYAGTDHGVLRSGNRGESWVEDGLSSIAVRTIKPAPGMLLASSEKGVHIRATDGSGWLPSMAGMGRLSVYALSVAGDHAYAAAYPGGIYRASLEGISRELTPHGRSLDTLGMLKDVGDFSVSARLLSPFPSPSNPEVWVPFALGESSDATVTIYNLRGEVVRRLELGWKAAGVYDTRDLAAYWDGRNELGEAVASGAYVVELRTQTSRSTRLITIVR